MEFQQISEFYFFFTLPTSRSEFIYSKEFPECSLRRAELVPAEGDIFQITAKKIHN